MLRNPIQIKSSRMWEDASYFADILLYTGRPTVFLYEILDHTEQ